MKRYLAPRRTPWTKVQQWTRSEADGVRKPKTSTRASKKVAKRALMCRLCKKTIRIGRKYIPRDGNYHIECFYQRNRRMIRVVSGGLPSLPKRR
jgi:hypothetical protein